MSANQTINNTMQPALEDVQALLRQKTTEIADIDKLLEETKKLIDKEKQKIQEKIAENTLDLREEYTRLYAAVNDLSLGFIILDKEKNISLINKTAQNFLSSPELRAAFGNIDLMKSTESVIKNGDSLILENVGVDGKYADFFISPQPAGAAILFEDKTEELMSEKAKEKFFIAVSHELRAPLTEIREYIETIKKIFFKDLENEEIKKIIADIDSSSARLISLVNDFLETPKLEPEKIKVKKERCDLVAIINSCIEEFTPVVAQKNLVLKFNNTLKDAFMLGDKERIRQILTNLIGNGIKYTEKGEITVSIEKTRENNFKISVKDTGKGIAKENTNLLFNKFQRIDPVSGTYLTSTGLGLYISKLLTEKMNGRIWLENSEEGKGSTFSFTLPAA